MPRSSNENAILLGLRKLAKDPNTKPADRRWALEQLIARVDSKPEQHNLAESAEQQSQRPSLSSLLGNNSNESEASSLLLLQHNIEPL